MRTKNTLNFNGFDLDDEIISLYRRARQSCTKDAKVADIGVLMSEMACRRYYINYREARNYCDARSRGITPSVGRPYHLRLLEAFYCQLSKELQAGRRTDTSVRRVIQRTLLLPAPILGMAPSAIVKRLRRVLKKKSVFL